MTYRPTAYCPRCNSKLVSDTNNVSDGYAYACLDCDEDFYAIEVNTTAEQEEVAK